MSRSERDLVIALRAELAAIDPARVCDRTAEAQGLGAGPRASTHREGPVARLAVRLRRGAEEADREQGGGRATAARPDAFAWDTAADHCRTAWLRGRFLARGSLSLAGGRTHLEFVVDPDEAPILAARLADIELPASWRIRRGRGVVTWKSGEAVETFLRRIGAGGALLELEARQVSRALRGDLNRVLNAESANLQRAGQRGRTPARCDRRASMPTGGWPNSPTSCASSRPPVARPRRRRSATWPSGWPSIARPSSGPWSGSSASRSTMTRAVGRRRHEPARPSRPGGPPGGGRFWRAGSGMIRADA